MADGARSWWDAAGDHVAAVDHDDPAAYLLSLTGPLGPLPLDGPPAERDILFSDHLPAGRYAIVGVAKLGVAVGGEVRREWTVDPGVVWWGRAVRDDAYTLEIRDRFGAGGRSDWVSLDPGIPLELARAQAVRLSRLTGDTVVWTRVLGTVDMY